MPKKKNNKKGEAESASAPEAAAPEPAPQAEEFDAAAPAAESAQPTETPAAADGAPASDGVAESEAALPPPSTSVPPPSAPRSDAYSKPPAPGICQVCRGTTKVMLIEQQIIAHGGITVPGTYLCQSCINDQPQSTDWKVWMKWKQRKGG